MKRVLITIIKLEQGYVCRVIDQARDGKNHEYAFQNLSDLLGFVGVTLSESAATGYRISKKVQGIGDL